jgi:ABC-type dipeptide/oligopeptide/nickel transport system permease component
MKRYLVKRIGYMLVTLFVIVTITFFLMQLLPGTPFTNPEKLTDQQMTILNALSFSLAAVQQYSEGNGDRIKKTPERFRSL